MGTTSSAPSAPARTLPAPVEQPFFTAISSYSVALAWPKWVGKNAISGYRVEVRLNDGPGVLGEWGPSGSTAGLAITVDGLSANTGYDLRVAAFNAAGTGEYGDYLAVRTPAAPPPLLYVSGVGTSFAVLNWVPQQGARLSYRVHLTRYTDGAWTEEPPRDKGESGDLNTFNLTDLVHGAKYKFRIASVDASDPRIVGDLSPFSHEVCTAARARPRAARRAPAACAGCAHCGAANASATPHRPSERPVTGSARAAGANAAVRAEPRAAADGDAARGDLDAGAVGGGHQ